MTDPKGSSGPMQHQHFRKNMRSRLLMLVALPLVVTLASVVWLERVLEKQLIGESMKQVMEARTVLQLELDEHARTLKIELLGLAQSAKVSQALESGDSEQVQLAIRDFAASHPEIDIILANSAGKILGTSRPVKLSNLNQLETLNVPDLSGEVTRALSMHGCERGGAPPLQTGDVRKAALPPARILAVRAREKGVIVACERLDRRFLERVSQPLEMQIALVAEEQNHLLLSQSGNFPVHAHGQRNASKLTEADGELWAVAEFCPKLFDDSKDDCAIDAITALSVSSLRDMVRRDFLWMLIPLLLVGLFALLWGGRIAYNLNETLERLLRGFRKLEAHSFETIEPMRTGNETRRSPTALTTRWRGCESATTCG